MAVVLSAALVWFAAKLWRDPGSTLLLRCGAAGLVSLLALQILLGAHIIWQLREPQVTTAHVVVGALLLAITFTLTWLAHRDLIEGDGSAA
jgi:cytochrome c oxidase assembly protein subunit 15